MPMVATDKVENTRPGDVQRHVEIVGTLIEKMAGISTLIAAAPIVGAAHVCARADALMSRRPPPAKRWIWTDDTAMAISIVEVLRDHGAIDAEVLAQRFARRYIADPARGYGRGAHEVEPERLYNSAIEGIIEDLNDPYSSFLAASDYENLRIQGIEGDYGGVGLEVVERNGYVTVVSPMPGIFSRSSPTISMKESTV